MTRPSKRAIVRTVLDMHPRSHADDLHIDVSQNTPASLYQWLIVSLLFSARISAEQAEKAARALFDQGWRTPEKMADTTWNQRVHVLNRSGYARYDESTSRYIGDSTDLLRDEYAGDLRKLREAAGHDPQRERELLREFKGIGEVGADIFCREAQLAWDELYPFADRKALEVAGELGLGSDARALAELVDKRELPRLLAGLVRVGLAGEVEAVKRKAA